MSRPDLLAMHVEIEHAQTLLDLTNEHMAGMVEDDVDAAKLWFCVLHGMQRHLAAIDRMVSDLEAGSTDPDLVGANALMRSGGCQPTA